jgi:hypothetical protein
MFSFTVHSNALLLMPSPLVLQILLPLQPLDRLAVAGADGAALSASGVLKQEDPTWQLVSVAVAVIKMAFISRMTAAVLSQTCNLVLILSHAAAEQAQGCCYCQLAAAAAAAAVVVVVVIMIGALQ